MQKSTLPVISECVIAFDLDAQRYITIGPGICCWAGNPLKASDHTPNFWHPLIHHQDLDKVNHAYNRIVVPGDNATIGYRLADKNQICFITEKRSLYTDAVSGHKILLSVLDEFSADSELADNNAKEHALKREQFLLSLINSQTNLLIRLNSDGYYVFVNKQYCNVLGYTESEIVGQYFSFTTVPEDVHLCEEAFNYCLENPGEILPLTSIKMDKQGNRHITEWEFISVVNESGNVTEIQGVGQDVTRKLEVEKQVKQTAEKLDTFIESITDSFFIVNNDWKFIKTNYTFERVSGKPRSETLGTNIWETFPWIAGTGFEINFRRAASIQKTLKFTEFIPFTKMWFRITVYPSAEGLTVFMKNITIQKKAEEELQWTQKKLESLINNTEDLIWSIDLNYNYIYINNAYKHNVEQATGIAPTNGTPVKYDVHQTNDKERWQGYYRRAFAGERFVITEELTDPNTDEPLCFEVSFNPIFKESGEVTGVGCFARDITGRLRTEKAIRNQNERLRQIASLSSHELRRPVASMIGLINIIDFENFNNPENKETIEFLLTVSNEIDDVIKLIVDNTFTSKPI